MTVTLLNRMFTFEHQSQSGELGRKMMESAFYSESLFFKYIPKHVPEPHAWGSYKQDPSTSFYLCDFHDMTDEVPEYQKFVPIIVKVHKHTMGKQQRYGFDIPTYLGNIPNDNTWQDSWEAWFTQAMQQMFLIEENAHGKDDELNTLKEAIFEKVIPRLLRPLETGGRSIKPCLIHSDLWPGNVKPDAQTNEICIFDSCAFWGHNEVELGSWRAPRYKMGDPFMKEYQRLMGMSEPVDDWDDRNALYALRYDMLWSALFPKTAHGYKLREEAKNEMARLVEKYPQGLEGIDER